MTAKVPSRKQLRKEQRKQKKARKNEYFSKSKHNTKLPLSEKATTDTKLPIKPENAPEQKVKKQTKEKSCFDIVDQERKKEQKELAALKKKMEEQRKKQLLLANEEEDRNIRKLAKQLKLNKRKSKALPKIFSESGLDYILEMCDPEQMKVIADAEKKFADAEAEFAEDLALITGKTKSKKENRVDTKKTKKNDKNEELSDDDFERMDEDFSDEEEDLIDEKFTTQSKKRKNTMKENKKRNKKQKLDEDNMDDQSDIDDYDNFEEESDVEGEKSDIEVEESEIEGEEIEDEENEFDEESENEETDMDDQEMEIEEDKKQNKRKVTLEGTKSKNFESDDDMMEEEEHNDDMDESMDEEESETENVSKKIQKKEVNQKNLKLKNDKGLKEETADDGDFDDSFEDDLEDFGDEMDDEEEMDSKVNTTNIKGASKINPDGTWEDIYGRLHAKDGTLMNNTDQKYVPPAVRAKMSQNGSVDKQAIEKLNRLKKQLKGLLNRLATSNMHNIAKQIEGLYMSNSRNDMNESLGSLINESIISQVLTPERLLMEHILLIAILHANIGTEVGAHFLQLLVSKFDKIMKTPSDVEDKTLDNLVIALAQMYNFKVFDSKLMHEILNELAKEFTEKNVDCILHVLKNVGFVLRKDDPLALKNFILDSNKKAASVTSNAVNGTRMRFLLDVLTAIKNNNMTKIPNYDDSYSEHLKKIMKGFIRKGNYVTQLNISLEDLLKADERGKWWVVGSAWTGNLENQEKSKKKSKTQKYSEELLELAKKLRMNTDTRRDIFCVIMSADGYDDAFEKLLHLGLTKNQEREIINVILHCCVKENPFNPYYAYLAQKFCEHDRKHMLSLKYSIWDKLKAIEKQSGNSLSSLASLLIHLFINEALPISTLKVIQFTQMDPVTTRFLRQIFLGILLHNDTELCLSVFKNVAQSDKLKMFRESLRLFLQLFVRKNLKSDKIDEKQRDLLQKRSKMIERLLVIKDTMNL